MRPQRESYLIKDTDKALIAKILANIQSIGSLAIV